MITCFSLETIATMWHCVCLMEANFLIPGSAISSNEKIVSINILCYLANFELKKSEFWETILSSNYSVRGLCVAYFLSP